MLENTVIIVGDSPFLSTIDDKMHYLLEKYNSIGINNSIKLYNVKEHIFQDEKFIGLTNKYPEIKAVTLYTYGDMIKSNKELYDSFAFDFKKDTEKDLIKDRKLAWCGFTHDYAISYCIVKGYKNIVLAGASDFIGGGHFATNEDFNYAEKLKRYSKRFIEEVCTKRASIYTLNPDSFLEELPRISIDELLK